MSHLGDNLSALVDGELTGSDLDRANAHLAACERCRGDAAALRILKSELRGLAPHAGHDELTLRLLAMGGQPSAFPEDEDDTGSRSALRRRPIVWSAVSLAVVGGVGAAAFSMGASPSDSGPDVVPQVQMFSAQHATTSGDVPFPEPSQLATRAALRKP